MPKRNFETINNNNNNNNNNNENKRIVRGMEMYYFNNYLEEIKYFNYKKKINKNDKIIKIVYHICLMPMNSIFIYNDKKYLFLEYNNIKEKVNCVDMLENKITEFEPNVKGERIINSKIQFYC